MICVLEDYKYMSCKKNRVKNLLFLYKIATFAPGFGSVAQLD